MSLLLGIGSVGLSSRKEIIPDRMMQGVRKKLMSDEEKKITQIFNR